MISIVTGVPGSGKSFYMVNYLSKFFTFDDFYREFHLKDNVLVISNVDGLKVPHLKLDSPQLIGNPDEGIQGKYTVEQFFTVANFEKLMEIKRVKNVILLIDESQRLFPRDFKDKDVLFFFQYHRHLGVDVILGCQDHLDLCRSLIVLPEFIYEAAPRSKSIAGSFRYHVKDRRGKHLFTKTLRKSQSVFRAYKSFTSDEISKPKNVIVHWMVFAVVLIGLAGFTFKTALAAIKSKSEKNKPPAVEKPLPNQQVFTAQPMPPPPKPFQNLSGVAPALSATIPEQPLQGSNDLAGFLPPDKAGQPVIVDRPPLLPPDSRMVDAQKIAAAAPAVSPADQHFNSRKKEPFSIYYVWKKGDASGMADDLANVPEGATFKKFRATW